MLEIVTLWLTLGILKILVVLIPEEEK